MFLPELVCMVIGDWGHCSFLLLGSYSVSPVTIMVGILVLCLLAAVIFLLRVLGVLYRKQKSLQKSFHEFVDLFFVLVTNLYLVISYFQVLRLMQVSWLRVVIPRVVLFIFIVAGSVTGLELVFRIVNYALRDSTFGVSTKPFMAVFETLWFLVPSFLIEALVLYHHFSELGHKVSESTIIRILSSALGPSVRQLNAILREAKDDAVQKSAILSFEHQVTLVFLGLFEERKLHNVGVSIMQWNSEASQLNIAYPERTPDNEKIINLDLRLAEGKGVAGRAFKEGHTIYVPSRRYIHGIRVRAKSYQLLPNVYVDTEPQPFKAVLSVPIFGISGQPVAVINFTSPKSNAFWPTDFRIATLAATILGMTDIYSMRASTLTGGGLLDQEVSQND
jgi:hypothetical protein